jgi:hypothetical protein
VSPGGRLAVVVAMPIVPQNFPAAATGDRAAGASFCHAWRAGTGIELRALRRTQQSSVSEKVEGSLQS